MQINNAILIASTVCSFDQLIQACMIIHGKTPTVELDRKNIKIGTLTSYAQTLEVLNNNAIALDSLKNSNISLDLIHLTFLIKFDDYDDFNSFLNICTMNKLHYQKNFGIICGTLRQYRELLLAGTAEYRGQEVRKTCNQIYTFLDLLGFREIFGKKRHLNDETFILELK